MDAYEPTPFRLLAAEASLVLPFVGIGLAFLVWQPPEVPLLIVASMLCPPAAVVLGVFGRKAGGEGKVVAGFGIVAGVLATLFNCVIPTMYGGHGRDAMRRAQFANNLKQVGLGLHNYAALYGRYPPAVVRDGYGKPLYSWRVLILPYIDEPDLYKQFHLDEPWDSPHNRKLLARMPSTYRSLDPDRVRAGHSPIQAVVGPGTLFDDPEGLEVLLTGSRSKVPDGLGNTIAVVEGREPVPWTAPYDVPFDPITPLLLGGGGYPRPNSVYTGRPDTDSFDALMGDGAVLHFSRAELGEARVRAMMTRNGAERLD